MEEEEDSPILAIIVIVIIGYIVIASYRKSNSESLGAGTPNGSDPTINNDSSESKKGGSGFLSGGFWGDILQRYYPPAQSCSDSCRVEATHRNPAAAKKDLQPITKKWENFQPEEDEFRLFRSTSRFGQRVSFLDRLLFPLINNGSSSKSNNTNINKNTNSNSNTNHSSDVVDFESRDCMWNDKCDLLLPHFQHHVNTGNGHVERIYGWLLGLSMTTNRSDTSNPAPPILHCMGAIADLLSLSDCHPSDEAIIAAWYCCCAMKLLVARLELECGKEGLQKMKHLLKLSSLFQQKLIPLNPHRGRLSADEDLRRDFYSRQQRQLHPKHRPLQDRSLRKILEYSGLQKVKRKCLEIYYAAEDSQMRQMPPPAASALFLGNPGTGKTTVARLFFDMLVEIGHFDKYEFLPKMVETSGVDLCEGTGKDAITKLFAQFDVPTNLNPKYAQTQVRQRSSGVAVGVLDENNFSLIDGLGESLVFLYVFKNNCPACVSGHPVYHSVAEHWKTTKNMHFFEANIDATMKQLSPILTKVFKGSSSIGTPQIICLQNGVPKLYSDSITGNSLHKWVQRLSSSLSSSSSSSSSSTSSLTAADLVNSYNTGAKGCGMIFIDEAYQIDPKNSSTGQASLNVLLTETTKRGDSLVLIMAGYKEEIEKKILASNPGWAGRFPYTFEFEDFSNDELVGVFLSLMKTVPLNGNVYTTENPLYVERLVDRITRNKGPSFANARTIHTVFQRVRTRQSTRIARESHTSAQKIDIWELLPDDILGKQWQADEFKKNSSAYKTLQNYVGLDEVKTKVDQLIAVVADFAEKERKITTDARDLPVLAMNRVFVGNPGTGKTEVAKLYGRILAELELLSKGEVIVVGAPDFIGQYVGETQTKTSALLERAKGCVLVVDEAYALAADPGLARDHHDFKKDAIDTIVARVQNTPADDLALIFCGYAKEMDDMFGANGSNAGLARRLNYGDHFIFKDYTATELMEIMLCRAGEKGYRIETAALSQIQAEFETACRQPNFGNGGYINRILARATQKASLENRRLLRFSDFHRDPSPLNWDDLKISCPSLHSWGTKLKTIINKYQATDTTGTGIIHPNRKTPRDLAGDLTFAFLGPPGTGKTTAAGHLCDILVELSLLPAQFFVDDKSSAGIGMVKVEERSNVVVVSKQDFVTGFSDQGARQTTLVMDRALGKLLFIDEAYSLADNKDVVDTLVANLTSDKYRGKIAVVFAGYENDILGLFDRNQGFKSRVKHFIKFSNITVDQCERAFEKLLASTHSLKLEDNRGHWLRTAMEEEKFVAMQDFSNYRDVERLATETRDIFLCDDEVHSAVSRRHVVAAIQKLKQERSLPSSPSPSKLQSIQRQWQQQDRQQNQQQQHQRERQQRASSNISSNRHNNDNDNSNNSDNVTEKKLNEAEAAAAQKELNMYLDEVEEKLKRGLEEEKAKEVQMLRDRPCCEQGYPWRRQNDGTFICAGGGHKLDIRLN